MKPSLIRFFAALTLLAVTLFSLPQAARADGSSTSIDIVSVNPGVSVTIRANNFPGGLFTVRMDKYGSQAANGTQVDVTNTGSGGSFQETYKIPAALKNENHLTIRLEKKQWELCLACSCESRRTPLRHSDGRATDRCLS